MFDANDTPVKQKNDHTSESHQIFCHNGSNNKIRITNWLRKLSRVTKIIQNTEKNRRSVKQTNPGINNQNWSKFPLKDPDTDRSSTLQKSFSNQNSRQRSLASNSSNNVYRKWPFSGLHKKNSPFQGYTNISKSNKSCCQFSN